MTAPTRPTFTPGPWEIIERRGAGLGTYLEIAGPKPDHDQRQYVGKFQVYGTSNGGTDVLEQARVNARLIAVAPDMYEALDALMSVVRARQLSPALRDDGNGYRVVDVDAMTYADTVLSVARAALAKADGR